MIARAEPSPELLGELIEAFAGEAARLPDDDQRVLLQNLYANYAVSDDPLGITDRRDPIIRRIAARIAA